MKYFFFIIPVWFVFSCGTPCTGEHQTTDIDSLVLLFPDSVPLLVQRGNGHLEEFRYEEALADGAKAFRLDSASFDARLLYADALNNKPGRTVEDMMNAQKHFKAIVKKQPKNVRALVSLASNFGQFQDYKSSFKYINAALKIDPRYRDGYVLKGSNYLKLNNMELAISSYETAVQEDPKFFVAYVMLGSLFEAKKDTSLCLEYYTTAARLQPNNTDVLYALAYAHQKFSKVDRAKTLYRKMISIDTTYSQALFQLGWIKQYLERKPDLDSAIYFYSSAVETTPNYVEAWHNLGICFKDRGQESDKKRAQQSFLKALKYNPNFELSKEQIKELN
jgi:tetratricopeptide (TPR) repeat protein